MDQWFLIVIVINVQNKIDKEIWIALFKRVNMHPQACVSFDVWIHQLDDYGVLNAERVFEGRVSLYDAMPVCWKHLNMDRHQEVIM